MENKIRYRIKDFFNVGNDIRENSLEWAEQEYD